MLREMGQPLVSEQPLSISRDEAIDKVLIGRHDTERRLKMLPRQREAMGTVVRCADDDEEPGIGALEDFLEAPGIGDAAAAIVHVRHERGPQPAIWLRLAGQSGATRMHEEVADL